MATPTPGSPTQRATRPIAREGSAGSEHTLTSSAPALPPLVTDVGPSTAVSATTPRRASAMQQASLGRGRPTSMMSSTSARPVSTARASSFMTAPDPTATLSRRSTSVATNASARPRARSRATAPDPMTSSSDEEGDGETSRAPAHRMSGSIEGVLSIGAHPSPSTRKAGEEEDDAVERVDRGEELIKRRMRARKRERKEAERRERVRRDEDARRMQSRERPLSGGPRSAGFPSAASDTDYDAFSQPSLSRRPTFDDTLAGLSDMTIPQSQPRNEPLSPRVQGWNFPPPTPGRSTAASQRTERDVFSERFGDAEAGNDEYTGPIGVEQHDSSADGSEDDDGDVEYTLKDRQDAINAEHPFGLPIWKAALYKKSRSVTRNADQELHSAPSYAAERHLLPGNILWAVLFGVPLMLVALICSLLLCLVPFGGRKYARVVYELGTYLLWPFGKYVEGLVDETQKDVDEAPPAPRGYDYIDEDEEEDTTVEDVESGRDWARASQAPTLRPGQADERSTLLEREATIRATDYGTNGKPPLPTTSSHSSEETATNHELSGIRVRALGRIAYWVVFYLIVAPTMLIACTLCWALVFTVPSARMLWALIKLLASEPLHLHFRVPPEYHGDAAEAPKLRSGQRAPRRSRHVYAADQSVGRYVDPSQARILLCIYRAMGLQYYKYTIGGINILFIDLMPLVFFVIFDYFLLAPGEGRPPYSGFLGFVTGQMTIFIGALLSVIPLSYFIGMAVASISAQSSIGMGAVINATFGSLIEIFLYSFALVKSKADLVEGSIVGSLLAGVLLMPGLSMIGGAFRRKEQRFNARSAGVTSTMLVMASIGVLTPTLFYEIYGTFQLTCDGCPDGRAGDSWSCSRCRYEHLNPADDPFYHSTVKYLSWYCAVLLVLAYLIGLWFSLRTHASQIWQNAQSHGEAAPRPSGAPRKLTLDVLQRLLPHSKDQTGTSSQHRQSQSQGTSSTARNAATAPVTPAQRVASDGPDSSSNALKLPPGLTVDEFNRAVEVVAATASVMRESALAQPGQLGRQASHTVQASDGQHRRVQVKDDKEAAPAGDGHGGHDAPSWTRTVSYSVLIVCTALYAVIAEILVDVVDVVLDGSGIPEKFLGVTLFALVPNTTEFVNAVSFALHGNIALSLEIGSAYALQVCLLQIPAMIAFSAIYNHDLPDSSHRMFTLVFPRWDLISILFSVFLLTYIYVEASSTYFRGSLLVLSYAILIAGFFMAPPGLDPILLNSFTYPITSALRAPELSFSQKVMAVIYSLSPPSR